MGGVTTWPGEGSLGEHGSVLQQGGDIALVFQEMDTVLRGQATA